MRALPVPELDQALVARAQSLRDVIAGQRQLQQLIGGQEQIDNPGFAAHLEALASSKVKGTWLTQITIEPDLDSITLRGRTTDAVRVPELLQKLSGRERFEGYRFDNFELLAAPEGGLEFAIVGPQPERRQ